MKLIILTSNITQREYQNIKVRYGKNGVFVIFEDAQPSLRFLRGRFKTREEYNFLKVADDSFNLCQIWVKKLFNTESYIYQNLNIYSMLYKRLVKAFNIPASICLMVDMVIKEELPEEALIVSDTLLKHKLLKYYFRDNKKMEFICTRNEFLSKLGCLFGLTARFFRDFFVGLGEFKLSNMYIKNNKKGKKQILFISPEGTMHKLNPVLEGLSKRGYSIYALGNSKVYKNEYVNKYFSFGSFKLGLKLLIKMWHHILKVIYSQDNNSDFFNVLREEFNFKVLYTALKDYEVMKNSISRVSPDVVLHCRRQEFGTTIGFVCSRLGIPVLWLQEAGHLDGFGNRFLIADKFAVWGDFTKEILLRGNNARSVNDILVIGDLSINGLNITDGINRRGRSDILEKLGIPSSSNKRIIAYFANHVVKNHYWYYPNIDLVRDRIINSVISAARNLDLFLIIKLHPGDIDKEDDFAKRYVKDMSNCRVVKQCNAIEIADISDVSICTPRDTLGIIFSELKKPFLTIDFYHLQIENFPYASYGVSPIAKSPEEVEPMLRSLLNINADEIDKFKQNCNYFLSKYYFRNENSKRILDDTIQGMINSRAS